MKTIINWFKYFGWGWKFPLNYLSAIFHPIRFFKCLKYPFIKSRNRWTGKFMGYSFTEDEYIPYGWYKAFGKDLLREIKEAGKASRKRIGKHLSWKKMIMWEQIKEKYGTLRLYASATEEIMNVLEKYEHLSSYFCIDCGKPSLYETHGWIEYYCEKCFEKSCQTWDPVSNIHIPMKHDEVEELKKECRIDQKELEQDWKELKEKYSIDFKEMVESKND